MVEYGWVVPIPLTLGVPRRRDAKPLLAGLLNPRCTDIGAARSVVQNDAIGPAVLLDGENGLSSAVGPTSLQPVRFHLDCAGSDLPEVLSTRLAAPLVVFVDRMTPDVTRELATAGHSVGLRLSDPIDNLADCLAVLAHTDVGFVARTDDGAGVVAALAATVAALSGADIRGALRAPDVAALLSLHPDAADAVRQVLLGVEVTDPAAVIEYLVGVGLR